MTDIHLEDEDTHLRVVMNFSGLEFSFLIPMQSLQDTLIHRDAAGLTPKGLHVSVGDSPEIRGLVIPWEQVADEFGKMLYEPDEIDELRAGLQYLLSRLS